MTVSVVTAGSTTAAVVGVGREPGGEPRRWDLDGSERVLAFTGAPHLALEGFVGGLLVMSGLLLTGLARRHRTRTAPALVPAPAPGDPVDT